MATAPIDIPIKVKGLSDLQKLEKRMEALEKTVEQLQGDLGKANEKIGKLNDEAVKASKGVAKLSKQFRSFAASILAAGTAQAAFNTGLNRIQSNARLVALARGYEEIEQAQAAATRTAEAFNLSQTEANKQFAAIYGRLRPLGLSVEQIEDAYAGLSTAVKTASLDAAGASALFTQVSQALGSGVVQAEELNTVIDQAPSIVVALAKELGVTAGEVKKLASKGQVSSEQLFKALLRVKEEGVDVLSESLNTPAEKIKAFYNTTEDIVAALTTAVIPELVDGVDDIAAALEALIPLAQVVGRTLSAAFKLAAIPAKGFGDLLSNIAQGNWDEVLKFDPSGFQELGDIFSDLFAPLPEVKTGGGRRGGGSPNFPTIPDRGGGGSKGKSGKSGPSAEEILAKQLEAGKKLSQEFSRQLELRGLESDLAKELKQIEYDRLDNLKEIAETAAATQQAGLADQANQLAKLESLEAIEEASRSALETAQDFVDKGIEEAELLAAKQAYIEDGITPALAEQYAEIDKQVQKQVEQLELMQGVLEAELSRVEANSAIAASLQEQIDKIKQLKVEVSSTGEGKKQRANDAAQEPGKLQQYMDQLQTELNDTEGMIVSLAQTVEGEIGSAMSNAIVGLIDGTKTAKEAFADMFKNIGKAFIDMATQMIAKALVMKALGILTGGGGGGGGGGFFPLGGGGGFGGTNYGMGGAGLFSYSGGGYTGDAPRAGGLDGQGGYLAMLHPQETVVDHHSAMGRYSSGNASGGSGSRTIRFESTMINSVEYVTKDQAMAMSRQAADDGAKRGAIGGHAKSMSTLKNSRSQRSKLGMR